MMRQCFTGLMLIGCLLTGVVNGSAHQIRGDSRMGDCCKKAQSASKKAELSMARLCCNLNCSEPGSSGASMSSSFSPQAADVQACAIQPSNIGGHRIANVRQFSPSPHTTNPKYLQHLALLI
ncbi:MAG TPA: hypothetical protein VN696_09355 [Pyrinomonadaceae bacterium]|nr:hypothetical protein [Pyrinomonadaceae bacterium]